ncbi:MAG: hypothetical protein NTU62_04105 [Spirochaetes bacterium]|nr:hypothetical protein [Spirochaetota bacterium]
MISIRTKHLAVVVPLVFAAGIGLTMAFNLWKTETSKVPVTFISGEFAGQANPADIRGSYTFADIVKAFPVPLEDLARAFGVTENAAAFQVKSLESAFLGTDSVRLFVARYAGLPYEPQETTALPAAAVAVLVAKGGLSAGEIADLRARAVGGDLTAAAASAPAAGTAPAAAATATTTAPAAAAPATTASAPETSPAAPAVSGSSTADHATTEADRTIKGKTTFKELLDWGAAEVDIRKVFGGEMGATGVAVRDYCTEKGIEFSTVKTALQDLVNAAAP